MFYLLQKKIISFFKRKEIKDSLGYSFYNIIEKTVPFLILPVITRFLSVNEVGFYMLYQAFIEILIAIVTLNVDQSILINFFKVDNLKFRSYFYNSLIVFFTSFVLFVFLSVIFEDLILKYTGFDIWTIILIFFILLFRFISNLRLSLWRIEFKIRKYGVSVSAISIASNLIGLIFIFFLDIGWSSLLWGHFLGYFVFSIFCLKSFYKEDYLNNNFDKIIINDILRIGVPISFHRIGIWMGTTVNRFILSFLIGVAATGSYGIAATFATMITIVEDAFSKGITPHIYQKLGSSSIDEKLELIRASIGMYLVLIGVTVCFFFLGYFGIDIFFGSEYADGRNLIFPLVISSMFKGFYKLHVHYIFFTKRTIEVTKITFATGIGNVILSFFLISNFGLIGAAYSSLVINFIQYMCVAYVGNKLIPMPWKTYFIDKTKSFYQ